MKNLIQIKNGIKINVDVNAKKALKYMYVKKCIWNPSICSFECDK